MDETESLVFTKQQAAAFADRVRRLVSVKSFHLQLVHSMRLVTRLANGRVLMNNDGEWMLMTLYLNQGEATAQVTANHLLDDATLRARIVQAETLLTACPWVRPSTFEAGYEPQRLTEGDLWKSATVGAITNAEASRDTALPALLDVVSASPFIAAGTVSCIAQARYILHSGGLEAYGRETDAMCSVRAFAPDGSSAGWSGCVERNWARIDVTQVAREAVTVATRALHPVAVEPGRYTVILSATAVGQLLASMAGAFDARYTNGGRTPFSKTPRGGNTLGERVVDERLRIWSDPFDPMGGCASWYVERDMREQRDVVLGFPLDPIVWIDGGVLKNLAYGANYAAREGKPYNRYPLSMHVAAVPGTPTMTVEHMIESCTRGIYVTRFSSISRVDALSGQLTGITRDGCFFIKDGKITKSMRNLRFLDAPVFVLNKVEAIGTPQRVLIQEQLEEGASFPVIVPPLMVRDFNFSALSDAV